jgi:archaellum component FlaG (FlaF/FlaG flagellin family)
MKKVLFIVLILLAGIAAGLLAKKSYGVKWQIDNGTVQICPPDCFPEETKRG